MFITRKVLTKDHIRLACGHSPVNQTSEQKKQKTRGARAVNKSLRSRYGPQLSLTYSYVF